VAEHISDGAVLDLLGKMLRQGVMESGKDWKPTKTGTPQGAVVSPLLANIYLNPLDHSMARAGQEMVRYADDFVILCESQKEAEEVLETLRQWVAEAGLTLHPTKTRIVDASQKGGFGFLGYHFERGHRWPRQKSLDKFRETIREKTRRLNSRPMREIVAEVNRTLQGWFQYFRHSVKNVFAKEDQFVRQRLRTLQRKRHKLQGRARGQDHQRWPNAYFAELGLISLALARDKASRSRRRDHWLESRMREIRQSGSEGGAGLIPRPYPYPDAGDGPVMTVMIFRLAQTRDEVGRKELMVGIGEPDG
jgi:RNA-directed DNA polymerase